MFRKRPVPGLIRGGNRFSDKNMRKTKEARHAKSTQMRKRIFNWQGQRFVYLWLEGEPGQPLEPQSQGLFKRADAELLALDLSTRANVVRTRVFGRTRQARDAVSIVRGQALVGPARAAGSSYISPPHFRSAADVALDLF